MTFATSMLARVSAQSARQTTVVAPGSGKTPDTVPTAMAFARSSGVTVRGANGRELHSLGS